MCQLIIDKAQKCVSRSKGKVCFIFHNAQLRCKGALLIDNSAIIMKL